MLANLQTPGVLPDPKTYLREAANIGNASFWMIGRADLPGTQKTPFFALGDEAAKLNLNQATTNMMVWLPGMTDDLVAAITDWRDTDEEITPGGAESEAYSRLTTPYLCKNGPFETVEELRLVQGLELPILYGDDANLNGALDANEDDGASAPPQDNKNGKLDPGLVEYFTVFSKEPTTSTNGTNRVDVTNQQELATFLSEKFGQQRGQALMGAIGGQVPLSVLQFYARSGMTEAELLQIEGDIRGPRLEGLVNVNTASEEVLACIPGIGTEKAASIVAYRQGNTSKLNSIAWVADALNRDTDSIRQAGQWLTGRSYQFSADIAAVGHHGRGYKRVRFVFDLTEGAPRIIYRRDLTHLGWALGPEARRESLLARNTR